MAKKYWQCIAGPIECKDLPNGADFPMRVAVCEAIERMVGEGPETISSGWGMTEEKMSLMLRIDLMDINEVNEMLDHWIARKNYLKG